MSLDNVVNFFMWCTIINGALLFLTFVLVIGIPNYIYKMHSKYIPISRQAFDVTIYAFLSAYKLLFIIFNLVPFIGFYILLSTH